MKGVNDMNKKGLRCYIYTRVSTEMQAVEGYSLEAQMVEIMERIEKEEMIVCGKYSDEGKSGMSIDGRLEFQRMLEDISNQKDNIDYVLVYKLSRFGRSAVDVLTSLEFIQDYGVELWSIKENIDTGSEGFGKLIISIMASVSEIEHDNIIMQTYSGKLQSVREGNHGSGAQSPFGYKSVYDPSIKKNKLVIDEEEAKIVRIIYDKYVNTNMGFESISNYLANQGYRKTPRLNSSLHYFSKDFVKQIIDNEIYMGKIAFGKRKVVKLTRAERKKEKEEGKRVRLNKVVRQKEYDIFDGKHEAIISEEMWLQAHAKREATGIKHAKKHSLDHEHILSGLIKCPLCGAGMYGNVNRKKRADGTLYKDYFTYQCKHRKELETGERCNFGKQWNQDKINNAVYEQIKKMVCNEEFAKMIKEEIGATVDTDEVDNEINAIEKDLKRLEKNKSNLSAQIDNLDIDDELYDLKYDDMQIRLNNFYTDIAKKKKLLDNAKIKKKNIELNKITTNTVYEYLLYFEAVYNSLSDLEKKELMNSLIDEVQTYKEEQEDGKILKSIKFKFPICYDSEKNIINRWDNETTVESLCLLEKVSLDTEPL